MAEDRSEQEQPKLRSWEWLGLLIEDEVGIENGLAFCVSFPAVLCRLEQSCFVGALETGISWNRAWFGGPHFQVESVAALSNPLFHHKHISPSDISPPQEMDHSLHNCRGRHHFIFCVDDDSHSTTARSPG